METTWKSAYLLFLLLISTYQDFFLSNYIGDIARAPIILLLPFFFLGELLLIYKKKTVQMTRMQRYLWNFIVYLVIISVITDIFFAFDGVYSFFGNSLFSKAIRVLLYFLIIFFYIRHVFFLFMSLPEKYIFGVFICLQTLLYIILIIEYLTKPNAFSILHTYTPYYRIRLLTSESSYSGPIIITICTINFYLISKLKKLIIKKGLFVYTLSFFVLYTIFTNSKGYIIVCIISLIIIFMKQLVKLNLKNISVMILSLIIVLILWNYFLGRVGNSLVEDVNEYTSVSTRVTTFLITIITFFHHPLGIGFSVYPYYFEKYSEIAMNGAKVIIGHFFGVSSLNFSEIFSYNFTDKNMGAKSGFMQWLLYGGIGALIYFYKSATYIKKLISSKILEFGWVFICLSVVFYISLEIKFEIWFFIAFIEAEYIKIANTKGDIQLK